MESTCSVDGCDRPAKSRDWCSKHYFRWYKHGDPLIVKPAGGKPRAERPCSVDGCARPAKTRELCDMHYMRRLRHGDAGSAELQRDSGQGCKVEECSRRHYAKGYCLVHLRRVNKYGDPLKGARYVDPPSVEERFFARVRQGPDGCWLWWRALPSGYGALFAPSRERKFPPHRWAYEFLRGEIPDGLVLDHLCENRACVNPWHLEPVTQQVNVLRSYRREDVDRVPSWAA